MKIENGTLILSAYDLDHVLTSSKLDKFSKFENVYEKVIDNCYVEINKSVEISKLKEVKVIIPKNRMFRKMPNKFENIEKMVKTLIVYKNNKYVFPYLALN